MKKKYVTILIVLVGVLAFAASPYAPTWIKGGLKLSVFDRSPYALRIYDESSVTPWQGIDTKGNLERPYALSACTPAISCYEGATGHHSGGSRYVITTDMLRQYSTFWINPAFILGGMASAGSSGPGTDKGVLTYNRSGITVYLENPDSNIQGKEYLFINQTGTTGFTLVSVNGSAFGRSGATLMACISGATSSTGQGFNAAGGATHYSSGVSEYQWNHSGDNVKIMAGTPGSAVSWWTIGAFDQAGF